LHALRALRKILRHGRNATCCVACVALRWKPALMRSHVVKRLQKSVQYIQRYSTKYANFLATSYVTFTNEPCQLWSYWTEFHEIFTQHTDIIHAVNTHIEIAISRTVLPFGARAKNARSISLPSFLQHYLVAMATYLDKFVN